MAEDNNTDLNALMGTDGIGYVPFSSAEPSNPLNSPSPDTSSNLFDTDYTQAFHDILDSPLPEIQVPDFVYPSNKGQGKGIGGESVGPADPFSHPIRYANKAELERYIHQDSFQGEGFNPFDPHNYDRWVAKENWSSALSKGLDSFGDKFSHTFFDYWKDYGRMVNALAHGDYLKLLPDEEEMLKQNYAEHISSMRNFVFIPEEDEDLIFSKRSISEFVGNAGFALGTFAGLATELAADALITLATAGGGVGAFGATASRVATKVAGAFAKKGVQEGAEKVVKETAKQTAKESIKKGNFFTGMLLADESIDVIKTVQGLKQVRALTENRTVIRDMKQAFVEIFGVPLSSVKNSPTFLNKAFELSKGLPLAGTAIKYGEKTIAAAKAGRGFGESAGIAFKGLRRVMQEYNLAGTEAAFEAVATYGATLDQMVAQHVQETGQEVDADTLMLMKEQAGNAAFANYGTNLAILLATNKIQFGTLFNKMGPGNKFIREMLDDTSGVLNVTRRYGTKGMKEGLYDTTGFLGMIGVLGKISKDFGKKQALYEVGRSFAKGIGRFELTEGLQENLQEMSNYAWQHYYAGRVNGVYKTLDKAFEEGAAEQFTAQGLRTFLQGALTGSFIRLPVHLTQTMTQGLNKYATSKAYEAQGRENPITAWENQRVNDISTFNAFSQYVADNNLDETMLNFTAQANEAMKATEAQAEEKEYEFVNARDNAMIKAAFAANRLNNIQAFQSVLKDMGENMTQEEFEEAFKTKLDDTKYATVAEFVGSVSNKIQRYSDKLESVRKTVKNKLVNPEEYITGTLDHSTAIMTRRVQEHAIEMIAMNELKANRAEERAKSVFDEYNSISQLASSSDYVYRVLSNAENLQNELGNILADIKVIEESLAQEGLAVKERQELYKDLQSKKKEVKLLNQWKGFWSSREEVSKSKADELSEEQEFTTSVLDAFIGKPSKDKIKVKQDDGTVVEETVYETMHPAVLNVFKEILNLKNTEANIPTEVHTDNIRQGFQKVVDFIQLEQDAKDYMSHVEALYSPETFRATLTRMKNGYYKSVLLEYTDQIKIEIERSILRILIKQNLVKISQMQEDGKVIPVMYFNGDFSQEEYIKIYDNIINAVTESQPFENILKVITSPDLGMQENQYVHDQLKEVDKVIIDNLKMHLQKWVPEYQFDEIITDEVWDKINADIKALEEENKDVEMEAVIPEEIIDAIINRIATSKTGVDALSRREKVIYDRFSGTISTKAEALKAEINKKKQEEEARKGKAYYTQSTDLTYTVYNENGNEVKSGLLLKEAEELVTELNKTLNQQVVDQDIDYIEKEALKAISRIETISTSTARGDDTTETYYKTVFYDLEGSPIELTSGTREGLQRKIDNTVEALKNIVTKGASMEEISEGPAGDPSQIGDIEEDLGEDLQLPGEEGNEKMNIISQIKQLERYESEGRTETPTGQNIVEFKQRLIDKLNAIEEKERGDLNIGEDASRRRANAIDRIEIDQDEQMFTTEYEDMNGNVHTMLDETREALIERIGQVAKFELDSTVKKSKTVEELLDEDYGKVVQFMDSDLNIGVGTLEKADDETKQMTNADVIVRHLEDTELERPIPAGSTIILEDVDTPGQEGSGQSNISSSTINDNVPTVESEDTEEEENEKGFPVIDSKGNILKHVETQEEADRIMQDMQQSFENFKWTQAHLKKVAVKVNKKGKMKSATISSLQNVIDQLLADYNAKSKRKKFTSFEEFYNNKTNKAKVDKAVGKYIEQSEDIVAREVPDATNEEVGKTTLKKKTNVKKKSDIDTQTSSARFQKELSDLHAKLQDLDMPTTTSKTGQIAVVFPEDTTDFTKFVKTSAEDNAINDLLKIKPPCKK